MYQWFITEVFPRELSKEVREAGGGEEETKHAAFADKDLPRLTPQRSAMWEWMLQFVLIWGNGLGLL